ncbi:hypothetical protein GH890_30125 [Bacillus thuringiensis]|nr:hypothetical protein [Bacillus thuringiensis]
MDRSSYLDNCSNSRANTCKSVPTARAGRTLLLDQNQSVRRSAADRPIGDSG